MCFVELLQVDDCYTLAGRGMLLVPDFPAPEGWKNCTESIRVVVPGGGEFDTTAEFMITHFNIADPAVTSDRRWRVVVRAPDLSKEQIIPGSLILVSSTLRDRLLKQGT